MALNRLTNYSNYKIQKSAIIHISHGSIPAFASLWIWSWCYLFESLTYIYRHTCTCVVLHATGINKFLPTLMAGARGNVELKLHKLRIWSYYHIKSDGSGAVQVFIKLLPWCDLDGVKQWGWAYLEHGHLAYQTENEKSNTHSLKDMPRDGWAGPEAKCEHDRWGGLFLFFLVCGHVAYQIDWDKEQNKFSFKSLPSVGSAREQDNIQKSRKSTFQPVSTVKIQIRLNIWAVQSESSLDIFWIARDAKSLHKENRFWSDCTDAQTDLSLYWVIRKYIFSCCSS